MEKNNDKQSVKPENDYTTFVPDTDYSLIPREKTPELIEELGVLLEQMQANFVLLKYDTCSEMMLEPLINLWKLDADCLYKGFRNLWDIAYDLHETE